MRMNFPSLHFKCLVFFMLSICFVSCQKNTITDSVQRINQASKAIGRIDSTFTFKDQVSAFFQDNKGHYWIGSKHGGVCRFDGEQYLYFTSREGLAANEVTSIQEDEHGCIWVDQGTYLSKFDGIKWQVYTKESIPPAYLNDVELQLSNDDLWFADVNRLGAYRYDGEYLSFISFDTDSLDLSLDNGHFFISGTTDLIDGQIWFGTIMQGILGFDGKQFEHIHDGLMNFESPEEFFHVRSILSDSKGNLWIGNNGIGVLQKDKNGIRNFSKEQNVLLPIDVFESNILSKQMEANTGLQAVFAIEEDAAGNIWFGERDSGLWKYDGVELHNYSGLYNSYTLEEMIWDIFSDQSGLIYCLLIDGSLFSFDGETFKEFEGFSKEF